MLILFVIRKDDLLDDLTVSCLLRKHVPHNTSNKYNMHKLETMQVIDISCANSLAQRMNSD